jgi:hypothetical protein
MNHLDLGFSKKWDNLWSGLLLEFRLLQLLPDSSLDPRDASNGIGDCRSRLGTSRTFGVKSKSSEMEKARLPSGLVPILIEGADPVLS